MVSEISAKELTLWEKTKVLVNLLDVKDAKIAELESEIERLKAEMGYHEAKDVIEQLTSQNEQLRNVLAESKSVGGECTKCDGCICNEHEKCVSRTIFLGCRCYRKSDSVHECKCSCGCVGNPFVGIVCLTAIGGEGE